MSIGSISPPPSSPPQHGYSLPCLPTLYSQHLYLNSSVSIGSISPPPLTAPTRLFTAVSPNPLLPTPLPQQQREYWIYLPPPPPLLTAPTGSFTAVSPNPLLPTPLPQQQREYWIYLPPSPPSSPPQQGHSLPCLPTLYSQHLYLNNNVSIGSISPPPSPPQRGHSLPCLPTLYSQHHCLNSNVSIGSISPPPLLTAPNRVIHCRVSQPSTPNTTASTAA